MQIRVSSRDPPPPSELIKHLYMARIYFSEFFHRLCSSFPFPCYFIPLSFIPPSLPPFFIISPLMPSILPPTFCLHSNLPKLKEVVENEEDGYVCKLDDEGHTLVHWAALGGYNEIIEYLLHKGAPLNDHSKNDYGPRPIHWACINGHVIVVELFVERGVDIDTSDLNGCSPLMVASQYGQSLVVSYLLQKGANKFHLDINGDTALHWAAYKGGGFIE